MFLREIFVVLQIFDRLGIFIYFNIAKKPYLENLSLIQNFNIWLYKLIFSPQVEEKMYNTQFSWKNHFQY